MIGTISIEDVVKGVVVNGDNVVDYDGIAKIIIPSPPEVPVKDVKVDGESVVDPQGDANIVIPVKDVKVDGESVIDSEGIANITIPDPPEAPVKDVKVDGESVVNAQGVANITLPDPPEVPVKDVKVNGESVVNAQGVANVVVPVISNLRVVKQLPGVSAAVVTVSDAEAFTMPSLTVGVEPVQEGSGDPSPENVRPISGWSEANVSVCGVNQFDKNATFVNAYCDYSNHVVSNNNMCSAIIPVKSGVSYRIITSGLSLGMNRYGYTKTYPQVGDVLYNRLGNIGIEEFANNDVITVPNGFSYLFITFYRYSVATDSFDDVKNAFRINYPSTDTSYHAYNGHTYTLDLNGTRYGGYIEIVNGVARFVATKGYIASYNGETLSSDWISDRDVYSEGTTPTIGAEVVYTLATPTIIPLGNYPISTLAGVNNIFADSGNVLQGEYASNIKVVDIG